MEQKKKFSLSSATSPLKAGRNRVSASFAASVILHLLVLSIPVAHEIAKARTAPDLEVMLVNARSAEAPKDAQILAQANLDGGGNSDEDLIATSPLPPQDNTRTGDDLIDRKRGQQADIRQRQEEQEVLTQENGTVAVAKAPPTPEQAKAQPQPASGEDTANAQALALQLQAAIDRNTQEYNQRPRRKFVGTRAQAANIALYIDHWKTKTERIGELNYPAAARGKIYGRLLMTVSIRSDGSVEKIVINRSSGHKVLDDAAQRIVRLGEPYGDFPPDLAGETDVLDITRTWTFTKDSQIDINKR
jgi:protein TonB